MTLMALKDIIPEEVNKYQHNNQQKTAFENCCLLSSSAAYIC